MGRMPNVYRPPTGCPLRWQDDITGVLPSAVRAFIDQGLGRSTCTPEQIELVRDYCEYYLAAPCWQIGDMEAQFIDLGTRIKTLKTFKELHAWVIDALNVGLDPF